MSELIGPLEPCTHRSISGLDAAHGLLEPPGITGERCRSDEDEDSGENSGEREHADGGAHAVGVENHQPGQHDGSDRADDQRTERDEEQQVAQRPGALGHAAQHDAPADSCRRQRKRSEHGRDDLHHGSNR